MRLQTRLFPDAMHGIFTDAQRRGEFAATPVSGAIFGLSAGGRRIRVRSFGVNTEAGCPGSMVSNPSSPAATKRCFQRIMVGAVVLNRCLIVLNDAPSASIKISLARKTYPAGKDRDWAMRLSSSCCSSLRTTESIDIPCEMATTLVTFTPRQATSSKGNWLRTGKAEAALSHIGFAGCASRASGAHWSVSVTHRFLRRGLFLGGTVTFSSSGRSAF
jgi:hypothetical protein